MNKLGDRIGNLAVLVARAVEGDRQKPLLTREALKSLIRSERWDEIRSFYPAFKESFVWCGGKYCFNWRSLTPAMNLLWAQKRERNPREACEPSIVSARHKTGESPIGAKKALYDKQAGRCYYCGDSTEWNDFSRDHAIPRSRGGKGSKNYVGSCKTCNHAKSNMTLTEFLETDYLPQERRAVLGFPDDPVTHFHVARKGHEERRKKPVK